MCEDSTEEMLTALIYPGACKSTPVQIPKIEVYCLCLHSSSLLDVQLFTMKIAFLFLLVYIL